MGTYCKLPALLGAFVFALPFAALAASEYDDGGQTPPVVEDEKKENGRNPRDHEGGQTEYEYRYEFKIIDNRLYRMDRKTGQLELARLPTEKEADKKVEELSSPQEPAGEEVQVEQVRPLLELGKENHGPIIDLNSDLEIVKNGFDPGQISDASRNHVRGLIAMYAQHIRTTQAIQVSGDRIEGLVTVTNRGARSIEVLELTLLIPIAGGSVESHRILLDGREGRESPPPPKGAAPKIIKLEMPAPGSVRTSQFEELKVTYIKFAN